jgi:Flp pilus assembly protein TadG
MMNRSRLTATIRACRRDQRGGAAAVEMAIVAPLFFLLALGICDFGALFFARQTLVSSAREGVRQLAIQGATLDEAIAITNNRLTNAGITEATVTGQNAYKGNGDDATARQVFIQVVMPIEDALLTGDSLNLFSSGATMTFSVTMRKEGELVPPPAN